MWIQCLLSHGAVLQGLGINAWHLSIYSSTTISSQSSSTHQAIRTGKSEFTFLWIKHEFALVNLTVGSEICMSNLIWTQ